jgi:hypothetical protein
MTKAGNWKTARNKGKYLFPVKAMSKVFRGRYVAELKSRVALVEKSLIDQLYKKNWVVYAKRPFGGPQQVLEYLGRYTHKIAISNHRLQAIDEKTVTFGYKDYRKEGKKQSMILEGKEFIRRFALHILPKGFVRIRHYGILSSTSKVKNIPIIRAQLSASKTATKIQTKAQPYNPLICACCKTETMKTIEILPRRGPPRRIRTIQAEGFFKA